MSTDSIPEFSRPDMTLHLSTIHALFPEMDTEHLIHFGTTILLMHEMLAAIEKYFKKSGISKARFLILLHLFLHNTEGGTCITDIRKSYPISSASMTVILDTLEKEHMVERIPNTADRRKVTVRITKKGEAFMQQFIPRHQQYVSNMTKDFSASELRSLPMLLHKLLAGTTTVLDNFER
ncbi:MAG: MarR family transcriptional regulator [Desulfovibrionales bacterium]|nr:MarR family transcriptional regulator [Desulfovibrionales bacterium]